MNGAAGDAACTGPAPSAAWPPRRRPRATYIFDRGGQDLVDFITHDVFGLGAPVSATPASPVPLPAPTAPPKLKAGAVPTERQREAYVQGCKANIAVELFHTLRREVQGAADDKRLLIQKLEGALERNRIKHNEERVRMANKQQRAREREASAARHRGPGRGSRGGKNKGAGASAAAELPPPRSGLDLLSRAQIESASRHPGGQGLADYSPFPFTMVDATGPLVRRKAFYVSSTRAPASTVHAAAGNDKATCEGAKEDHPPADLVMFKGNVFLFDGWLCVSGNVQCSEAAIEYFSDSSDISSTDENDDGDPTSDGSTTDTTSADEFDDDDDDFDEDDFDDDEFDDEYVDLRGVADLSSKLPKCGIQAMLGHTCARHPKAGVWMEMTPLMPISEAAQRLQVSWPEPHEVFEPLFGLQHPAERKAGSLAFRKLTYAQDELKFTTICHQLSSAQRRRRGLPMEHTILLKKRFAWLDHLLTLAPISEPDSVGDPRDADFPPLPSSGLKLVHDDQLDDKAPVPLIPRELVDELSARNACPEQREVLYGLSNTLEIVQGPPATGKTTFLAACVSTIAARSTGDAVLVCAVQNKALEAAAVKLSSQQVDFTAMISLELDKDVPFCKKHALGQKIQNNRDVQEAENELARAEGALGFFHAKKAHAERDASRKQQAERRVKVAKIALNRARTAAKKEILESTPVFLCTLTKLTMILISRQYQVIRTRSRVCVLDEAGTVPEHLLVLLAALAPENLVLVGDQAQLPPFTSVPIVPDVYNSSTKQMEKAPEIPHFQSGMSRLCELFKRSNRTLWMLKRQYRMHRAIAAEVSNIFYDGQLVTDELVDKRLDCNPMLHELAGLWWLDCERDEEDDGNGRVFNIFQAEKTMQLVELLYESGALTGVDRHGFFGGNGGKSPSLAIICFYSAQVRLLKLWLERWLDTMVEAGRMSQFIRDNLQGRRGPSPREWISVHTVDSMQGNEADVVILNTVRRNSSDTVGFLGGDVGRKRICVASSRAKSALFVIGCQRTLRRTAFGEMSLFGDRASGRGRRHKHKRMAHNPQARAENGSRGSADGAERASAKRTTIEDVGTVLGVKIVEQAALPRARDGGGKGKTRASPEQATGESSSTADDLDDPSGWGWQPKWQWRVVRDPDRKPAANSAVNVGDVDSASAVAANRYAAGHQVAHGVVDGVDIDGFDMHAAIAQSKMGLDLEEDFM